MGNLACMHTFILWVFRQPNTERAQSVLKLNLLQCPKGLSPLKLKETFSSFAADAEHNHAGCVSENEPQQSGSESPQQKCGNCNIWFQITESQNTSIWKGPLRITEYNSLLLAKLLKTKPYDKRVVQILLELWLAWCVTTSLDSLFQGMTTSPCRSFSPCPIWTSPGASWFHFVMSCLWSPEEGDQHSPLHCFPGGRCSLFSFPSWTKQGTSDAPYKSCPPGLSPCWFPS